MKKNEELIRTINSITDVFKWCLLHFIISLYRVSIFATPLIQDISIYPSSSAPRIPIHHLFFIFCHLGEHLDTGTVIVSQWLFEPMLVSFKYHSKKKEMWSWWLRCDLFVPHKEKVQSNVLKWKRKHYHLICRIKCSHLSDTLYSTQRLII